MKSPSLHRAVADDAVDRRANLRERQIAFGLGLRGLQFLQLPLGFLLLRFEHADIGDAPWQSPRARFARRRSPGRGCSAPASSVCLLANSREASDCWRLSSDCGAGLDRLRGGKLRIGLRDRRLLRHDLLADAADGRRLGGDLAARGLDRQAIIAIVDAGDDVAGMDELVVLDRRWPRHSPTLWRPSVVASART